VESGTEREEVVVAKGKKGKGRERKVQKMGMGGVVLAMMI